MSQLPDDIGLFFRYTIPGTIFVSWIVAGAPLTIVHRITANTGLAELFLGFLASMVLVGGWISYSGYYPVWQAFLRKIHFISELKSHATASETISAMHAVITPKSVWSFFLWSSDNEHLRARVKTLANYAHSAFMAGGGLVLYPIIYAILRLATRYTSVLSRFSEFLSGPLATPSSYVESIFIIWSVTTGIIIMIGGRKRWIESDEIQLLLSVRDKTRLEDIVKNLAGDKSGESTST